MPAAIPVVVTAASIGAAAAFTETAFFVFGIGISYGALASLALTVAGTLLQGALAKKPGAARVSGERQNTVNQAAQHRGRCFGRVKVGGALALYDATDADELVHLVVHGQGPHAGIVAHELDGEAVTLDGAGLVTAPAKWAGRVRVITRSGAADQAAMAELSSRLAYWTSAHRLRGLACSAVIQTKVAVQDQAKVYPGGVLNYRQTLDGADDILDPRTGLRGWSDNPALLVAWRLTSADGYGLSEDALSWSSFAAAADVCDAPVALKAGGTERQFRAAGQFSYEDAPAEVVRAILACCDGDLHLDDDGRVAMRIGAADVDPSAVFAARHVAAMTLQRGPGVLDRYNRVVAVYTDPARDYQPVSAPAVVDAAAVAAAGVERTLELEVGYCFSASQAQRLAKRMLYKLNPRYQGEITANLAGLASRERARCALGWDGAPTALPMIVSAADIDAASLTVTLAVQTIDPAAYLWDPATEEQDQAPTVALGVRGQILAPPAGVAFAVVGVAVDAATTALAIRATWTPPADGATGAEMQISRAGLDIWQSVFTADARAGALQSGVLVRGQSYDARVRFTGSGGGATGWVTQTAIAASGGPSPAEPVATFASPQDGPASPVAVVGTITVVNEPGLWRYRVFRGLSTDDFADATEVATIYVAAGGDYAFSEPLAAGDWRYWALVENTAGNQSSIDGPVPVTVTVTP